MSNCVECKDEVENKEDAEFPLCEKHKKEKGKLREELREQSDRGTVEQRPDGAGKTRAAASAGLETR